MKMIVGFTMIVGGAILGLYVGVWVCFIGGTVDVIEAIKAPALSGMTVAIGVAKVVFSGLAGWLSVALLALPGWLMLDI